MPTIYIAGPMRSIEKFNFPAFDKAAEEWRKAGWNVINPADLDREVGFEPEHPDKFCIREAMGRDTKAICEKCDAVAFLPGWEKSSGAKAERALADAIGIPNFNALFPCSPQKAAEITKEFPPELKIIDDLPKQHFPQDVSIGGTVIKDSGNRRTFNTGAQRDRETGKGDFAALPYHGLLEVSQVFEAGAKKYTRSNWRLGMPLSEFCNSMLRHAHKAAEGWDDENHAAMVAWNALCFIETRKMIADGKLPAELNDIDNWLTVEGTKKAFETVKAANVLQKNRNP